MRLFLKTAFIIVLCVVAAHAETKSPPLHEPFEEIRGAEHYFPDEIGMRWTYSGSIADQMQRISSYTNIAKVTGTLVKEGETTKVFSETNAANQGPTESYVKKDKKGILYFGSEPTTHFERQIVPYRIIGFPVVFNKPYVQVQRSGIPYDEDYDQDGQIETADVYAQTTAVGFETISTPAGTFRNTLRFEGRMTIDLTLSSNQKRVQITDEMTHWFALGIGMIKGIEKVAFPSVGGKPFRGVIITELLQQFSKKEDPA